MIFQQLDPIPPRFCLPRFIHWRWFEFWNPLLPIPRVLGFLPLAETNLMRLSFTVIYWLEWTATKKQQTSQTCHKFQKFWQFPSFAWKVAKLARWSLVVTFVLVSIWAIHKVRALKIDTLDPLPMYAFSIGKMVIFIWGLRFWCDPPPPPPPPPLWAYVLYGCPNIPEV